MVGRRVWWVEWVCADVDVVLWIGKGMRLELGNSTWANRWESERMLGTIHQDTIAVRRVWPASEAYQCKMRPNRDSLETVAL